MVIWFSASTSSRKASKGSSARSSSSISSTGERGLRQRLQQRPLDQHARANTGCASAARGRSSCAGLGQADLDHLARHVPLVGGLRDVQAFVALQRAAAACPARAPAPWPARSCRRRARLRGTAGAAASGQEQRGGQPPVADVVLGGQQRDDGVDRCGQGRMRSSERRWRTSRRRRPGRGARPRSVRALSAPALRDGARGHHADHRGAVLRPSRAGRC